MADEPLALSTAPPAVPPEDDYDAMCKDLQRTERGRRFLEEHGRRCRDADPATAIDAIEPADAEADTRHPPADVLAAVERLQDVTWIMREQGIDLVTCGHIEDLTSTILATASLHDPRNRRARQLGEALDQLERYLDRVIVTARGRADERSTERSAASSDLPAAVDVASEPPEEICVQEQAIEPVSDGTAEEIAAELAIVRLPTMWESQDPPSPPASLSASPWHDRATPESPPSDFLLEPVLTALEAGTAPPSNLASPSRPRLADSPSDIDNELFASPRPPILEARPQPAESVVSTATIPPPPTSRHDPLAALNAMSDEEKIALFT
jgi:hypothetical protein